MSFEKSVTRDLLARSLQMTARVLVNQPDGEPDANVRQLHDDLIAWHGRYGGDRPPVGALPDDSLQASEDWHLR